MELIIFMIIIFLYQINNQRDIDTGPDVPLYFPPEGAYFHPEESTTPRRSGWGPEKIPVIKHFR